MSPSAPIRIEGWTLTEVAVAGSTNDLASRLPAWHALRADGQTAGRGRHRRTWVSDAGGLWLSAVVPVGPPDKGWAALPLAAGLAVCETLDELGACPIRLRWPNDVMSGYRKLAGLLVDQVQPETAVVGLGMNVVNRPEAVDPSLDGGVVRLADLTDSVPDLRALTGRILQRLRAVTETMHREGFTALVDRVNRRWNADTRVELETDSTAVVGSFLGVDVNGRLLVRAADGTTVAWGAHQVRRLHEIGGRTGTSGD